ncbi:hypothetical protein Esti_005826 [Eimeria stiedai]
MLLSPLLSGDPPLSSRRAPEGAPAEEAPRARRPVGRCPPSEEGAPSGCPMSSSSGWKSSWLSRLWSGERGEAGSFRPRDSSYPEGDQETLDPSNLMPALPNTSEHGLSTQRQISSIPKTGAGSPWVYPSAAQFFKALQRKGKEADSNSIPAVVYVHNFVNQETWEKIQQLEKQHPECREQTTLTRFCGRFDNLTLTARLMKVLGCWGSLFDRHDWYVDRCGQQVRYIIDYYDDPQANNVAQAGGIRLAREFQGRCKTKLPGLSERREALARFLEAAAGAASVLLHLQQLSEHAERATTEGAAAAAAAADAAGWCKGSSSNGCSSSRSVG